MARYDTIIFDLDGTLLDTLDDLMDAVNHALGRMGYPPRSREEIREFVGNGVTLLIQRAVPAGTTPEDTEKTLALFKDFYALHMGEKTAVYPGILELLKALRERGYKLAVVSNKFDAAVKTLAEEYFPSLLHTAAGENEAAGVPKKPDPAMVFQVLDSLGATPERAVYVGDSDVDLQTAANAGLPCISVTWGFRDREFLKGHGATVFADTPADILPLV